MLQSVSALRLLWVSAFGLISAQLRLLKVDASQLVSYWLGKMTEVPLDL